MFKPATAAAREPMRLISTMPIKRKDITITAGTAVNEERYLERTPRAQVQRVAGFGMQRVPVEPPVLYPHPASIAREACP